MGKFSPIMVVEDTSQCHPLSQAPIRSRTGFGDSGGRTECNIQHFNSPYSSRTLIAIVTLLYLWQVRVRFRSLRNLPCNCATGLIV